MSGILMNDATDNLPIFVVIKGETRTNKDKNIETLSRRKTEESVMSFKRDLINQDWKEVYVEDVNDSYNSFLSILTDIYDKNCPLVKKKNIQTEVCWENMDNQRNSKSM